MQGLSLTRWRPIAHRVSVGAFAHWRWSMGFAPDAIHAAERADEIIVMTRGADLVARIAGPNWKRLRRAIKEGRS